MPTLRERLINLLLGDEKRKIEAVTRKIYQAYLEGPHQLPPDELVRQLGEYDSAIIYDLVTQLGYDSLAGRGYGSLSDTAEREWAVAESRRLYKYDVMYQWQIWLWTNFVFSEAVKITPVDDRAKQVWDEFWNDDFNSFILADDNIQRMSEDLLVDGNLFLAYYISKLDGKTIITLIPPNEITEIVYNRGGVPMYYKRSFLDPAGKPVSVYYPTYQLLISPSLVNSIDNPPALSQLADYYGEASKTVAYIQHIAYNRKSRLSPYGYPLGMAGFPWIRAHKRFREDRATVASAVAMYVNKLKVKGGSRALDLMRSQIQSGLSTSSMRDTNPPAPAGSTWLENEAAELSRMPLSSGGGDAKADGDALLLMAGLGGGVYPHWMGAGDAYRLATATSMESPMERQFMRYQRFWTSQFRKMARIVFTGANEYGNAGIQDMTVDVSIDSLIKSDLQVVSNAITSMLQYGLQPYLDAGIIDNDSAKPLLTSLWRVMLQALDIDNANEILQAMENQAESAHGVSLENFVNAIKDIAGKTKSTQTYTAVFPSEDENQDDGKFHPTLPSNFPPEDETIHITADDVQAAIEAWKKYAPPDIAGILDAESV